MDGHGTLGLLTLTVTTKTTTTSTAFFSSDGTQADISIPDTQFSALISVAPASSGFWLLHEPCRQRYIARHVLADGTQLGQVSAELGDFTRNPAGGFVQARKAAEGNAIELRWVSDELLPQGDWHLVTAWPAGNREESILVNQTGDVLVLTFYRPLSFGLPPPQSEWRFSARWFQLVHDGAAFLATRKDTASCARTALLISRTGVTCFELPFQASALCGWTDRVAPDGTLVTTDYRSKCLVRWWPGLGQLAK